MRSQTGVYGVVAEFEDAEELVSAARAARERGYRCVEAYSPYPISELNEVLPAPDLLPPLVLGGGIVGAITAYYMQYWIAVIHYPLNVGGRPLHSAPSFIVITFELTVLFASIAAFFGMLFFAGFPSPYHPMFRIPDFRRASDDGFFLCIEARDPRFFAADAARFLQSLGPLRVWEVEHE
ncbi:MAG TPA: DUF3341 domain-containing protein [Candidatus Acidoferrales bacterium]|nr:DUF3341 domain-containing protein [Candidatus Acidoferrales bacterium]